tara:strand:+ start:4762 stop:5280 length:519 start_codon:yes stop_codon:yes gene_type:complete
MPFLFMHLIGAWILGKVCEFASKKKINHYAWFLLLVGAIIPDIDFLVDWTLGIHLHRTFTHSIFFALLSFAILYIIFWLFSDKKARTLAFAIGAGVMVHIFFDAFSAKGIPLLWPVVNYFSFFNGIQATSTIPAMFVASDQVLVGRLKFALLDAATGVAWIFYLWLRKRIQF